MRNIFTWIERDRPSIRTYCCRKVRQENRHMNCIRLNENQLGYWWIRKSKWRICRDHRSLSLDLFSCCWCLFKLLFVDKWLNKCEIVVCASLISGASLLFTCRSSVIYNVPSATRLDDTTIRIEINVPNWLLHSKFIACQISAIRVNNVDEIGVGDI